MGILSMAVFGKTDLEKAARAGALCMVVRTHEWLPKDGDTLHNTILCLPELVTETNNSNPKENLPAILGPESSASGSHKMESAKKTIRLVMLDPPWHKYESLDDEDPDDLSESELRLHIHGCYNVPPGYGLRRVPRQATFTEPNQGESTCQTAKLSYNYSLVKIMVSLGQAIYAIFTIYQARGDQIAQFGYAAFGLTVAPYAVSSVLNLLGSLICPEFPAIYMVESSIMEEARRRGGEYFFEGTIGKVDEETIQMKPKAPLPEVAERQRWVLEPVAVSVDYSGRQQVSSEMQVELSPIITGNAKLPETAVEEGQSGDEKITAVTGNAPHDQTENQAVMEIMRPAEGNRSTSPTYSKKIVQVNTEEAQSTTAQPSSSSDHLPKSDLLVPLSNPIKRKERSRQTSNYKIHIANSTTTTKTLECKWEVTTNEDEGDMIWLSSVVCSYFGTLTPVMINGALSRFHKGHSTHAQRAWTMTWLAFGVIGSFLASLGIMRIRRDTRDVLNVLSLILLYAAPAIGGFVVVGQMLRSYGTCINLS
jgi:hypothetical protein